MNTQGWKKKATTVAIALLLLTPAGCLSARNGTLHPFATMFQNSESHPLPAKVQPVSCALNEYEFPVTQIR